MPKGLKPIRKRLATGEVRLYWYHRATGKALKHDPESALGLLEVAGLDKRAEAIEAATARSIRALWRDYTASPEWIALKPRTRSDYQAVFEWLGAAADTLVAHVTTPDVVKLRDRAFKQKGRRFANYVVQVLRMLFEWGRLRGWGESNPALGKMAIRRPQGLAQVNRAWSIPEVRAFALAAPPQLAVPFVLGLFAGMRQGDALIATWAAYDGAAVRWIAGKNGEACMAPVTGAFKLILDGAKAKRGDALQMAVTSNGTPWTQSGFRASFFKLVRKLVKGDHLQPGCTFHGLRHTIAANAVDRGESSQRIAAAIGDRSAHMALIYGRDHDARGAQATILEANQQRFGNIDWKPERKLLPKPDGK